MDHLSSIEQLDAESTIPAEEAEREIDLSLQIPQLWRAHRENKLEVKRTKLELMDVRRELSAQLREMKTLLARTGRGGMWASFLKEKRIPRATADRYVASYDASLPDSAAKRLTEAFPDDLYVAVGRLVNRIQPQLIRELQSSEAVFAFVVDVLHRLPEANFDVCGGYPIAHLSLSVGNRNFTAMGPMYSQCVVRPCLSGVVSVSVTPFSSQMFKPHNAQSNTFWP